MWPFKKKTVREKLAQKNKKRIRALNGFAAGSVDRTNSDWNGSSLEINENIRNSLFKMRARSRDLALNNDYVKKYLNMFKINVVGPNGFTLQANSRDTNGELDRVANDMIEAGWKKWSKLKNCTVQKNLSLQDVLNTYAQTLPRDGEFMVRMISGFDNEFRFALQLIDMDLLDEEFDDELSNGNIIRMSIEYDIWRSPVAYHLLTVHPGANRFNTGQFQDRQRIPANEIIHIFSTERPHQVRGYPWLHAPATRLNMIGKYEEAELVSARIGASKMGFFTSETGNDYVGDDEEADGTIVTEAEPGIFEQLPKGMAFSAFNPEHPSGNFSPFMKTSLRGIASGLNVSYHNLANDLEGVNFSSIRQGVLDERANWRQVQKFTIEHLLQVVFENWLPFALLSGAVDLPILKLDKFMEVEFIGRAFEWIDPLKDVKASVMEIKNGLKTRKQVLNGQGKDLNETFEQLQAEEELIDELGLTLEHAEGSLHEDEEEEEKDD